MSDRSHVTILIPEEHVNDSLYAILEEHVTDELHPMLGEPHFLDGKAVWEFEDLAWGTFNNDIDAALHHLKEAGVPFTAIDGGHYTWPPEETGWRPGMDMPRTRYTTVHGPPVLTQAEWRQLTDLDPEETRQRLAAHFGEDPQGWISPTPDW